MGIGDVDTVLEKQRYYQNVHKFTHLKGPHDRITSVLIPWAFVIFTGVGMARGLYHLANGTGKIGE